MDPSQKRLSNPSWLEILSTLTNTGGTIETETEKDFVQALNRIYHDVAHPSHLILPIIERD
jgi:predicted acyl esterase